jgi:hypothetical protein
MNKEELKVFCEKNILNRKGLPDPNKLKEKWFIKTNNKHIYDILISLYPNASSFSSIIFNIINDISTNSLSCPICNKNFVKFINFTKGYTTCCSIKCSSNNPNKIAATKQTCINKYGTDHPFKSIEIREKIKQTCIDRYGVDNALKSKELRKKVQQTCIDRYGVDHPLKSDQVKEKIKQTCIDKYGVDNSLKSDQVKEKIKQTCIDKYGVDHPFKSTEIREKIKQTFIDRYGVDHQSKSDQTKEKIKQTCIDRYGVDSYSKTEEFKIKSEYTNILKYNRKWSSQKYFSQDTVEKLSNKDWLIEQHHFNKRTLSEMSQELNVDYTTVKKYLDKHDIEFKMYYSCSSEQKNIYNFLSKYIKELKFNVNNIIPPKELDIFIPEKNLAIEYCGLYWHSSDKRANGYHYNKYIECKNKGIRLITIFEDEWLNNTSIVEKKLLHILNINDEKKIFARKCNILYVNDSKNFLDKFHIQGYGSGSINIGLEFDSDLVACMSFRKLKDNIYEINRYATSCNVIGGFSKILTYFKKKYTWTEIITFADLRWHNGDVYLKNGFCVDKFLYPDYQYILNKTRIHKFNFRKKYIQKKFPDIYDDTLTEIENMNKIGIPRIYDCGKLRFLLQNNGVNNAN